MAFIITQDLPGTPGDAAWDVAGQVRLYRFLLQEQYSFHNLIFYLSGNTGTDKNVSVAIYSTDWLQMPTPLVQSDVFDAVSGAVKTTTFLNPITLGAGEYYWAWTSEAGGVDGLLFAGIQAAGNGAHIMTAANSVSGRPFTATAEFSSSGGVFPSQLGSLTADSTIDVPAGILI